MTPAEIRKGLLEGVRNAEGQKYVTVERDQLLAVLEDGETQAASQKETGKQPPDKK